MKKIVLDASVLLDIMVASRPRHMKALPLFHLLQKREIRVRLPFHAFIELASATKNEQYYQSSGNFQLSSDVSEEEPLLFRWVAIDPEFLDKYFDSSLPYMKASDAIYVMMAKGDNAILITEDNKQKKRAIESGVEAYDIDGFLTTFS